MRYSLQAVALAAFAIETAIATPHLRHLHLHNRAEITGVDWNDQRNYNVDWKTLNYNQGAAASPTPTPAAVAAPKDKVAVNSPAEVAGSSAAPVQGSTGSSGGGSGSCVDISKVWNTRDTSSKGPPVQVAADFAKNAWTDKSTAAKKRATEAEDGYVGNTGSGQVNNNIVPLSNCDDQSHAYTIKFTNSKPNKSLMYLALWNKVAQGVGSQGGPFVNSFFYVPLSAGQSVAFAFAPDSQIAFAEANSDICHREDGAPGRWNCAWGEANLGPASGGMSSWDVSTVWDPNVPGDLTISSSDGDLSSRAFCYFRTLQQQYAGEGVETCNPNSSSKKLRLHAQFGINLSKGQS